MPDRIKPPQPPFSVTSRGGYVFLRFFFNPNVWKNVQYNIFYINKGGEKTPKTHKTPLEVTALSSWIIWISTLLILRNVRIQGGLFT